MRTAAGSASGAASGGILPAWRRSAHMPPGLSGTTTRVAGAARQPAGAQRCPTMRHRSATSHVGGGRTPMRFPRGTTKVALLAGHPRQSARCDCAGTGSATVTTSAGHQRRLKNQGQDRSRTTDGMVSPAIAPTGQSGSRAIGCNAGVCVHLPVQCRNQHKRQPGPKRAEKSRATPNHGKGVELVPCALRAPADFLRGHHRVGQIHPRPLVRRHEPVARHSGTPSIWGRS
jgi:hypothetical protein